MQTVDREEDRWRIGEGGDMVEEEEALKWGRLRS